MARARRQAGPKAKPRANRAARPTAPMRRSSAPQADVDLQPVVVPVTLITREVRHFGQRRLKRLMDVSAQMLAVRDVGDVALIHSRFMLDSIDDYVGEVGRMAQIWIQAFGQNYGVLRSNGEAVGRDAVDRAGDASATVSRSMADLAMTSAVVQ